MYCPKCGTENAETNKFCRACRENLKVVSQAMKQRLPVVLASIFDQLFDSRSERFRRDSILYFLMGLGFLGAGLSGPFSKLDILWFFAFPICFLFAAWEYLVYRRSLAPNFAWEILSEWTETAERFGKNGVVTLDIGGSHTEDSAQVFCPMCGQRNEGNYKFCRGCGENLKATGRRQKKLLYRALDSYISSEYRTLPGAMFLMFIGLCLLFVLGWRIDNVMED